MDAIDRTLLRLADPGARSGLLTADALLQLATVGYAIDPATVTGATTAVYDRVDLAVPVARGGTAAIRLMRAGDALPWDATLTWDDPAGPVPGADAMLVARLAVRAARAGGTIETVDVSQPNLDAAFAAALAGLPASASDEEVRAALRTAAAGALAEEPLTEVELDSVLAAADPRMLGRSAGREAFGLRLTMSVPPNLAAATPLVLPVVVAVLIADAQTGPRELLRATHAARRAALAYPLPDPPRDAPPRRTDRCVCWLLPAAAFEDDGWPGSNPAARLAAARDWLAAGGIAVVTT